jgi:hypothetical protein
MTDLLPRPFCGGEAEKRVDSDFGKGTFRDLTSKMAALREKRSAKTAAMKERVRELEIALLKLAFYVEAHLIAEGMMGIKPTEHMTVAIVNARSALFGKTHLPADKAEETTPIDGPYERMKGMEDGLYAIRRAFDVWVSDLGGYDPDNEPELLAIDEALDAAFAKGGLDDDV